VQGAYPRSRGATSGRAFATPRPTGLSPLARGNQRQSFRHTAPDGPIPARAGQPWLRPSSEVWQRAYPRSRGATRRVNAILAHYQGLSPLARGNPASEHNAPVRSGPIPARAGQPRAGCADDRPSGAYPRSRGATNRMTALSSMNWGLSPLARGNLAALANPDGGEGPIPARAGQPHLTTVCPSWSRAYPRSRGATFDEQKIIAVEGGLSPLARGNLAQPDARLDPGGPIPARAGQPSPRPTAPSWRGAYPRSRGAT